MVTLDHVGRRSGAAVVVCHLGRHVCLEGGHRAVICNDLLNAADTIAIIVNISIMCPRGSTRECAGLKGSPFNSRVIGFARSVGIRRGKHCPWNVKSLERETDSKRDRHTRSTNQNLEANKGNREGDPMGPKSSQQGRQRQGTLGVFFKPKRPCPPERTRCQFPSTPESCNRD